MDAVRPTIKGTFVLSHIKALRVERGESAVQELQKRYGKPLDFPNGDYVPVADEVKILEHIVDISSLKQLSAEERALAAGRLHFKNFSTTPLWTILAPLVRRNMKTVLMQTRHIAERVFRGVRFTSTDVAPNTVNIKLENNDYPLEHFQGFFEEWIHSAGLVGAVEANADAQGGYTYTVTWR